MTDLTPCLTRSRVRWYLWPALGGLGFTVAFGFLAARPHGGNLWDFGSFHLSGYAASHGFNPYGDELLNVYASEFNVTLTVPNLNPPLSVPVFQLLAKLDPRRAFRVWWWLSLGLHLGCVLWLVRSGPGDKLLRGLWGLGVGGLWMTLALGQIYVPLELLVTVAYHALQRQPTIAGICIGLVAGWKPNFLLWPVLLFTGGYTRAASTALLVFAIVSAVPAILFGTAIYREWITAAGAYHGMHVATNLSLVAWLSALLPQPVTWVFTSTAIIVAAGYVAKRRPGASFCSDLALVLATALFPIAWAGYTLLLLPIFLRRRVWRPPVIVSAGLFAFPANLLWQWSATHPDDIFGPRLLYPVAISSLFVALACEQRVSRL